MAMQKVTAAVIEKDGKILIARRKRDDSQAGKWEFPGGKLEAGETPEACLKRELREELGIETEVGAFFCSSRFVYPQHGCATARLQNVLCFGRDCTA